jgi:hypothetical protein
MLDRRYPRDLVMIGVVFGIAAFVWAGWAQESPPAAVVWRVVLAILSAAGIALVALSIPVAIRHWHTATAIDPKSTGFRWYVIIFWAEVIVAAVLSFLAVHEGRSDLLAPLIQGVVGVHFFALAVVFRQFVLHVAAVLLTVIAVLAGLLSTDPVAPSFWCGLFGSPVLLIIGAACLLGGRREFRLGG